MKPREPTTIGDLLPGAELGLASPSASLDGQLRERVRGGPARLSLAFAWRADRQDRETLRRQRAALRLVRACFTIASHGGAQLGRRRPSGPRKLLRGRVTGPRLRCSLARRCACETGR